MKFVYPDDHKIYAFLNSVRTDITSDVVDEITGKDWGIIGNRVTDRVGAVGELKFTLKDKTGKYIPGSVNAVSGWKLGIPIELEIIYDGTPYIYRFYVRKIEPPKLYEDIRTVVTCLDWMDFALNTPIENPGVLTDQTADQVLQTAVDLISTPPQNTDFDTGNEVFPTSFDTVTSHSTVYSEAAKVAYSELGYVYLVKDRIYGETLVLENSSARNGTRVLDEIPNSMSASPALLKSDGGFLKKSDGGHLKIYSGTTATFDNAFIAPETSYGDNLVNHFRIVANLRRIDETLQILFHLDQVIAIPAGVTFELKGTYADPNGGAPINAQDLETPVATTDYLANTLADGSGVDITANLTLVSVVYGTEGFTHRIRNDDINTMWITQYNVRGIGIYRYNPIEHVAKDQASIDDYRTIFETLNQDYKTDLYEGKLFADAEVWRESQPRLRLNKLFICANYTSRHMLAFLNCVPGTLIHVIFDKAGIDNYFYIQAIDEVTITEGGLIFFKWVLKMSLSIQNGLTGIAIDRPGSQQSGIDFGYVPKVEKPRQRTFSIWFYSLDTGTSGGMFFSTKADGNGLSIATRSTNNLFLQTFSWDSLGSWYTPDNSWTPNTWQHLAVTYDTNSPSNDPAFYINGVLLTTIEFDTPTGNYEEEFSNFVVGNLNRPAEVFARSFYGKLFDARVYARILSESEIQEIYNGGVKSMNAGPLDMVFQTFAVKTIDLSSYINVQLTQDTKVADNISGIIGTPAVNVNGGPYGRTP